MEDMAESVKKFNMGIHPYPCDQLCVQNLILYSFINIVSPLQSQGKCLPDCFARLSLQFYLACYFEGSTL